MKYYKEIKNGKITSYQLRDEVVNSQNYVEITEEEYNQAMEELISVINIDNTINENPTYEELEQENAELLYELLTGEEL